MKKPKAAFAVCCLLVAAFLINTGDALAQGRSRSLVLAGLLQADINLATTEYLRNYSSANTSRRQSEQARLLSQLNHFDNTIEDMHCSDDLHRNVDLIRTQLRAAPPDSLYLNEPTSLVIPLYAGVNLCLSNTVNPSLMNYFFLGNLIGNIGYMYQMLGSGVAQPPGTLDGDILNDLDRLARIAPDILTREEFPEEAKNPLRVLVNIANEHANKEAMSTKARKDVHDSINELTTIFSGT